MEQESDSDASCNLCPWDSHQKIGTRTEVFKNKRAIRDNPNYIVEISQNTEKSPGDLRRLAVSQKRMSFHWCEKVSNKKIIIAKELLVILSCSQGSLCIKYSLKRLISC